MMEKTFERRGRRLLKGGGGGDEDIHTLDTSSPHDDDHQVAAKKSNDEIRIGPITRARAKLLEQQVNSLLIESEYFIHENCLLPKSLFVCILRFVEQEGIALGSEELQHLEQEDQGMEYTS